MMNDSDMVKVLKMQTSAMSLPSVSSPTLNVSLNPAQLSGNANLVDLGKKLLDAARNGETEEVKTLMQGGAPFTTDWLGTSPLHFAAQYGHTETAEVLLRAGISRDARTKVDRTPLHIAAQEGHLSIVTLLIIHGADIDARDMLKMTPLHWAVERGHIDVVECLLTNGADVNMLSKFEKSPIDIAFDNGRLEMANLLQKYVGVSRPKPEPKPNTPPAKMRPTVLPNKSNRTAKLSKHTTKPVMVPNLLNWPNKLTIENLKKFLGGANDLISDGEHAESNSNSVLATLAALASASSSSGTFTPEQLLEAHAISVNSSNDSTLFQNALEGGQTISLTEAGKLALNLIKEQQSSSNVATTSSSSSKNSKVITIVADSTQLPQIISSTQATPIVLVSGSSISEPSDSHYSKTTTASNRKSTNKGTKPLFLNTTNSISTKCSTSSDDRVSTTTKEKMHGLEKENERLLRELDQFKKLASEYKEKYLLKEKEAEKYKRQLEDLKASIS